MNKSAAVIKSTPLFVEMRVGESDKHSERERAQKYNGQKKTRAQSYMHKHTRTHARTHARTCVVVRAITEKHNNKDGDKKNQCRKIS